ncbi:MAG: phosphate ABC transporter substrate-binding protein [Oscillospiraceae bacterium]|jgi:phosphate transport system substrate-binding protein|nr:phosphate ABC transporter substrate-binding protein [Oscillospiraceae bacterium]
MKRLIITLIILSAGFASSCAARGETNVIVSGSTSVLPYVEILVEEYRILYPEYGVGIQGGGSSAGILAAVSGFADIGMSSRALNEDERDLWSSEIALDGLAIIIHPDNPVDNLSMQQLRDIYTRRITNWSEVGGRDARIHIIAREAGSGTRSAFQDLVMEGEVIHQRAIVQNSNGAVRQLVSGNRDTIGFISLGLAEPQPGLRPVKALQLDGVAPTRENVLNGSYGLYRAFLFVMPEAPEGYVGHFIDYILSEEGQQLLIGEGLISVSGRIG